MLCAVALGTKEWTNGSAGAKLAMQRSSLGARIRSLRLKRRMSLTELARRTGVSVKTVGGIESGIAFPSLPLFYAICRVLKCGRVPMFS